MVSGLSKWYNESRICFRLPILLRRSFCSSELNTSTCNVVMGMKLSNHNKQQRQTGGQSFHYIYTYISYQFVQCFSFHNHSLYMAFKHIYDRITHRIEYPITCLQRLLCREYFPVLQSIEHLIIIIENISIVIDIHIYISTWNREIILSKR